MDIQMPEMGGHATTRRIRMDKRFAAMPIIAMTAHATTEEREECVRSGMQDHITKPINPDHFYRTLAYWLAPADTRVADHGAFIADTVTSIPDVRDRTRNTVDPISTGGTGDLNGVSDVSDATSAAEVTGGGDPVNIPGFDTVDTLYRLSNDVDLYHRVLEMLVPSLSGSLMQFSQAASAGDHVAAKSAVHTVCGMAANVGATELATFAGELEELLAKRRERPEDMSRFREMVERTLSLVEQALATRKAA
jgi:CheY-like chemotaxis protein